MTINEAVKQICKVPYAKSNTRKVLKEYTYEIKKEAHLQGYIKAGDEVMTRIEDMIQAKLKRNDNPILKAGLLYALTVINGL